jgi:hypothetical protein
MPFLAWFALLVFTGCLMPRLAERGITIAAPPAAAVCSTKPLAGLGEIKQLLLRIGIENDGAYGHLQNCVATGTTLTIRTFSMPPALGAKFPVVAIAK